MTRQTVADIGEFALIDRLLAALPEAARSGGDVRLGAGDDAAIWRPDSGRDHVVTTDALVEGIHFRLDWASWGDLGHKALAVNLSDLAAMGADPAVAVVTLGLRGDEGVGDLEAMYRVMGALAVRHGCTVAGGDIVRSPAARMVAVTAIGTVEQGRALLRTGARPGDVIAVTGTLGASAAGLRILREPERFASSTTASRLVRAHLRPEPRFDAARVLCDHEVSCAMDLSDGLLGDLPKILQASGVSAVVREVDVPVIAAVRALFPDDANALAMSGGEDYELLFTVPADRWETLSSAMRDAGVTATAIGEIVAMKGPSSDLRLVRLDGSVETVASGAFDHFNPGMPSP